MDDQILDLDNLAMLLTRVLQQMDWSTLKQITAVPDNRILEEMLLDAIGVVKQSLDPEEQERYSAMVESVLNTQKRRL